MSPPSSPSISRRAFLAATALATTASRLPGQEAGKPDCLRCGGLGLVPLADAKPFVWVTGSPPPKPETAVGEQHCPLCHPTADANTLVAAARERIERAQESHAKWKERLGGKLLLVLTRHAAVHTQYTPAQAKTVGQALETFTLHLKRVASSLALTPTRMSDYELFLLWERPAWDQFRKVMEGLYTPQQLGEDWKPARDYNSYDHFAAPHLYETPQTSRQRPLTHGPVFLAARRQIVRATKELAPLWLSEGFAEYADHTIHKANRWFTVYVLGQGPPAGEWFPEARRLATAGEFRPWSNMIKRELRDWKPNDYIQALAMATFLVEAEPAKFLDLVKKLAAGEDQVTALEETYRCKLDDFDLRCTKWLLARR